MALDLSETLVVGISATALFDMSESDQMFKAALEADPESVIDNYRRYMQAREGEPLAPGTGYHLIKALLDLNRHMKAGPFTGTFAHWRKGFPHQNRYRHGT